MAHLPMSLRFEPFLIIGRRHLRQKRQSKIWAFRAHELFRERNPIGVLWKALVRLNSQWKKFTLKSKIAQNAKAGRRIGHDTPKRGAVARDAPGQKESPSNAGRRGQVHPAEKIQGAVRVAFGKIGGKAQRDFGLPGIEFHDFQGFGLSQGAIGGESQVKPSPFQPEFPLCGSQARVRLSR